MAEQSTPPQSSKTEGLEIPQAAIAQAEAVANSEVRDAQESQKNADGAGTKDKNIPTRGTQKR